MILKVTVNHVFVIPTCFILQYVTIYAAFVCCVAFVIDWSYS